MYKSINQFTNQLNTYIKYLLGITIFIFKLCECENSNYSCYCFVNYYSNIISNEFLEKKCFVV